MDEINTLKIPEFRYKQGDIITFSWNVNIPIFGIITGAAFTFKRDISIQKDFSCIRYEIKYLDNRTNRINSASLNEDRLLLIKEEEIPVLMLLKLIKFRDDRQTKS